MSAAAIAGFCMLQALASFSWAKVEHRLVAPIARGYLDEKVRSDLGGLVKPKVDPAAGQGTAQPSWLERPSTPAWAQDALDTAKREGARLVSHANPFDGPSEAKIGDEVSVQLRQAKLQLSADLDRAQHFGKELWDRFR